VKEYDVFIPLYYNDGTPVESAKFQELQARLLQRFEGLTGQFAKPLDSIPQKVSHSVEWGKIDAEKLKIGRRLRAETTMTWAWIARHPSLGAPGSQPIQVILSLHHDK
jgi:hypothetical protein